MILMQTPVSLGKGGFWKDRFKTLSQSLTTVALLFVGLMSGLQAQDTTCVLACADRQVSLDENCEAIVTVRMLADTSQCTNGMFVAHVLTLDGDTIPTSPMVTENELGMTLMAVVEDTESGQTCWSTITVEDKLPPIITCDCPPVPLDSLDQVDSNCVVNCLEAIGNTDPVVTENCGDFDLFLVDEVIEPICDSLYIRRLTRSYVAVDEAGMVSDTCEQVFFLERIDFDLIEWPDSATILGGNPYLCDEPFLDLDNDGVPDPAPIADGGAGVPTIGGVPIYPDFIGTCNAQVFVEDVHIGPIGCVKKVMRMWTAFEWHCQGENDTLYIQLIEITDEEGPDLTCPDDVTVSTGPTSCDAMVYIPVPDAVDNCNDVVQISATYPGGFIDDLLATGGAFVELPVGPNEITFTAYDECLNSSTCVWTVTVADNTPPIPICDEHTVVSLTNDGPDGLTLIPASAFDDGSYDECGPVTFTARRMTSCIDFDWTTGGAFIDNTPDGFITSTDRGTAFRPGIPVACCDVGAGPFMVILRVEDASGNVNTCMVEVTVQDKIGPFITCPPDITVSCDFDFNTEDLSIFGTVETDENDIDEICLFDPSNPGADAFGFVCFGEDGFADDNCDVIVEETQSFNIDECGTGFITRTFTATDPGGRTNQCTQFIYIENFDPFDPDDDVIWPPDVTITGCGSGTDPDETGFPIITEDECDLIGYTYEDQVFPFVEGACFKILRTWQIIDWCQYPQEGPWEYLQVIKVIDDVDPEFISDQPNISVCNEFDCDAEFIELIQTVSDDCTPDEELVWTYGIDAFNDGNIDIPGAGTGPVIDASGEYPIGNHRIVYTVEDNCGNKTTREQLFNILACKPPTPICLNGLSADLMPVDTDNDGVADWGQVTLWASDFDKGSLHTCGYPVTVSFSPDTTDTQMIFDCTDLGSPVVVQLWVTDLVLGNQAFCETFIDIQDNMNVCPDDPGATGVISGLIATEDAETVNAVHVSLDGSPAVPVTTESTGQFVFPAMPTGGAYTVKPEKNDDWTNGVSTLDLVRIQKYLLGLEHLGSPYKMIAADANNSGSISAIDLVILRKLILGTITEIDGNTSWRFVDSGYEFQNPNNPFSEDIPEEYFISNFQSSMAIDFKAIKVGDVNNTVQANLGGGEDDAETKLNVKLDDRQVVAGEIVEMTFTAEEAKDLLGYQFTLNFDNDLLSFVGVNSEALDMTKENIGLAKAGAGAITTSWSSPIPVNVSEDEELFTFTFRANRAGSLNGNVWINSDITKSESYDADGNVAEVDLVFEGTDSDVSAEFALLQNMPNPFDEYTEIAFTLPKDAETVITVYDIAGKAVFARTIDAVAGYNKVTIDAQDLQGSGVMYYNVSTGEFSATRKMVMIR